MKINTITRHNVYNYGATLQAFALQEYLKSQSNEVEIIDYQPIYDIGHYGFHWYVFPLSPYYNRCRKNPVFRFAYCLNRGIRSYKTIFRKWKFDKFDKEFLNRTGIYKSYNELLQNPPDADVYIAGSDQIWYAYSLEGQDESYYLGFVEKGRKISYAASFGTSVPNPDFADKQKKYVSNFDTITVREKAGQKILERWSIPAVQVCDPVFLLNKEDWMKLIDKAEVNVSEKYILIYNLGKENSKIKGTAEELARKYGLKIYSINSPEKMAYADKSFGNIGPKEFLKMIYNAQIVLTNSFHCTAFSIILNKPFYSFAPHNVDSGIRIKDLIEKSGKQYRYEPQIESVSIVMEEIDMLVQYSHFVAESKKILNDSLNY